MPLYDRKCDNCLQRRNDCYESSICADYPCPKRLMFKDVPCPGTMRRIPMTSNPGAIGHAHGDECDVTVTHGLCNADGTPHRYRSKSEMKRETEKRGLTNLVEHKGSKDSDKSKFTQRWY